MTATPEQLAVIEAARKWKNTPFPGRPWTDADAKLEQAITALDASSKRAAAEKRAWRIVDAALHGQIFDLSLNDRAVDKLRRIFHTSIVELLMEREG